MVGFIGTNIIINSLSHSTHRNLLIISFINLLTTHEQNLSLNLFVYFFETPAFPICSCIALFIKNVTAGFWRHLDFQNFVVTDLFPNKIKIRVLGNNGQTNEQIQSISMIWYHFPLNVKIMSLGLLGLLHLLS